jgi:hypothetical protein
MGRSKGWLVLAAIACLAFVAGCSDECSDTSGPATCVAGGIRWCAATDSILGSRGSWYTQQCTAPNSYCVVPSPGAAPVCMATPEPAPECANIGASASICFQNAPAACMSGYPVTSDACDAGPCTVSSGVPGRGGSCAFCQEGTTAPDPGCTSHASTTCFNGATYHCDDCGNRTIVETDCAGQGLVCIQADISFCALSAQPDPRCSSSNGLSVVCAPPVGLSCYDGYLLAIQQACSSCVDSGPFAGTCAN